MSDVVRFRPAIVGDGSKIDAKRILSNISSPETVQSLAVVYVDAGGNLLCASTDGRAETLMLFERAKARPVAGYED